MGTEGGLKLDDSFEGSIVMGVTAALSVVVDVISIHVEVDAEVVSGMSDEVFSISSTVAGVFVVPSVDNDHSMTIDGSVSIGSRIVVESCGC